MAAPGSHPTRWSWTTLDTVIDLLRPLELVRFALHDNHITGPVGNPTRPPVRPELAPVLDSAMDRSRSGQGTLLSIGEGAACLAAVRGIVGRMQAAHRAVLVLVAKPEVRRDVLQEIWDLIPRPPEREDNLITLQQLSRAHPGDVPVVTLDALSRVWDELDEQDPRPQLPQERTIVAVGVDAGFRGIMGFRARMMFPDVAWISITEVPREGLADEARHAFGNPRDELGVAANLHGLGDRVPVEEALVNTRSWVVDDAAGVRQRTRLVVHRAVQLLRPRLPTRAATATLILVEGHTEAYELAAALRHAGVERALDATTWTHAHQGWEQLSRPTSQHVVVRSSFPHSAVIGQLDAVFVLRGTTHTTLARMRNLLGRAWADKPAGLLFVDSKVAESLGLPLLCEEVDE